MEKLWKVFEEISLKSNIINTFLVITLIVSLISVFRNPQNQIAIFSACCIGGFMNILNGLKLLKLSKQRTIGMTYIMMGIILVVIGFVIYEILKKS